MPALSMSTYCSVWASKPKVGDLFSSTLPTTIEPSTPEFSSIWRMGASSALSTMLMPDWTSSFSLVSLPIAALARSTLAALTGLLYLGRSGAGGPLTGEGAELQAMTAVILGGTSLFGGQGGLIGTLGGVLLVGLTNTFLVILNVSSWYQELKKGLVIVPAVALYKQKRR